MSTQISSSFTVKCGGCGAPLALVPGVLDLICDYCAATTHVAPETADSVSVTAAVRDSAGFGHDIDFSDPLVYILPAKLKEDDARLQFYQHIALMESFPDRLLADDDFFQIKLFHKMSILLTGSYEVDWTASFCYTDDHLRDEWRPATGSDNGAVVLSSLNIAEGLAAFSGPLCRLEDVRPYNPGIDAGVTLPLAQAGLEQGLQAEARAALDEYILVQVRKNAQGDDSKGWHCSSRLSVKAQKVLLPVYEIQYEYDGSSCRVAIDGFGGAALGPENAPVDKRRLKAIARWRHLAAFPLIPLLIVGEKIGGGLLSQFGNKWAISGFLVGSAFSLWRISAIGAYSDELRKHIRSKILKIRDDKDLAKSPAFFQSPATDIILVPLYVFTIVIMMMVAGVHDQ